MTHPHKAKGNRAELAVATFLRDAGFPYAERSRAGWSDDRGDIDGIPGVVIEVKDCKRHDLAGWMTETEQEVANAKADTGLLVVKRRMHANPADWYAITRLGDWVYLAKEAGL